MKIKKTNFEDLYIIELEPYNDERGSFTRTFCIKELKEISNNFNLLQINKSFSKKRGTLRGLHMQKEPYSETKIIQCTKGKIFDVAVDLRKNSPTFLKYFNITLEESDNLMIVIPKGFVHGFQTLEDNSEIQYFVDQLYSPNAEKGVLFNEKKININWPLKISSISEKDLSHLKLSNNFTGV